MTTQAFRSARPARVARIASMLALATLGLGGQTPQIASNFVESQFRLAKQADAAGDFATAAANYEVILKRYPDIPQVRQNVGIDDYLLRKYEQAIRNFEAGLRIDPTMTGAHLFLGASYVSTGQPSRAIPHLKFALAHGAGAEAAMHLGLAYKAIGRFSEAGHFFRQALDQSTEKYKILFEIGDTYSKQARVNVESMAARNPETPFEHIALAQTFDLQEQYELAAAEYMKAATEDPYNAGVFINLARDLAMLQLEKPAEIARARGVQLLPPGSRALAESPASGQKGPAIGQNIDYETELRALPEVSGGNLPMLPLFGASINGAFAAQLKTDTGGRWKAAAEHLSEGRWREAIGVLRGIPGPQSWLRQYLIAAAQFHIGDSEAAEETLARNPAAALRIPDIQLLRWRVSEELSLTYFDRLLTQYPDSSLAHFIRGRLLDEGRRPGADAEYRAAVSADPGQTGIHAALAEWYLAQAKHKEAIGECEEEMRLDPYSAEAKKILARIYNDSGESAKALPLLESVLAADPGDIDTISDLARSQEAAGRPAAAIETYKRVLALDPAQSRTVHYALARLYKQLGQPELAKREFELFRQAESVSESAYQRQFGAR